MIEVPVWVLIALAVTAAGAIVCAWIAWLRADRAEDEVFATKERFFPAVTTPPESSTTKISTQRYNELLTAERASRARAGEIEKLREEQRQERQFVEERGVATLVAKALVMIETHDGPPIVLTRAIQEQAGRLELVVHREDGELELHVRETGLPPDRKWVTA